MLDEWPSIMAQSPKGSPVGFPGGLDAPDTLSRQKCLRLRDDRSREFFNNCYRVLLWQDLANFAAINGDNVEKKRCEDRLATLRPLIHNHWFDPARKTYTVNRQAYLIIALRARIMPEELRPVIFKQLEDDIVITHKGHLDCGLQGSAMLLDLLVSENRPDLAALVVGQETYPGWGFLVKERKVTSWPETWSGWGSQAILVVGTVGGWFYEGLAGIRPDPAAPGFKHFTLRPGVVQGVDWVKCHHDSPYGCIAVYWEKTAADFKLNLTVPPNTTATVFVPGKDPDAISESGTPVSRAPGVRFLRTEVEPPFWNWHPERTVSYRRSERIRCSAKIRAGSYARAVLIQLGGPCSNASTISEPDQAFFR